MSWKMIARGLRLAFLLRIPLAMLLLLAALGPAADSNSFTSNLLDQERRPWFLFVVSFSAFLLAFTGVTALNLTLLYGKERLDETGHAGLAQKRPLLTFACGCLAAAILDAFVFTRTQPLDPVNVVYLLLGFVAALALVFAAKLVQLALTDPQTTPHPPPYLIFPAYVLGPVGRLFEDVYCWRSGALKKVKGGFNSVSQWPLGILRRAGQGYLVPHKPDSGEPLRLLSGHVFAGTLATIAFLTYLGIAFGKARITDRDARVPALAFVLLFLIVACWLLSALSFFFDRYRFPLLWVLIVLGATTAFVPQSDHFFRVKQCKSRLPDPPTAPEYLATRLNPPRGALKSPRKRLIFVATPGGGIQAAAWTAEVLTELEHQNPSAFRNSVAAISSVSGGSLGAIIYGASFDGGKVREDDVPLNARRSAIDEVAWGLTVPDFWRIVIPWLRIDRSIDRGWALEKKWGAVNKLNDTRDSGTMLSQWGESARAGTMPALIINSMLVERGQPVVFSTTRFPAQRSDSGRIVNFYDLYQRYPEFDGHYDVRVNTAARLSASFPYVAPASRPALDAPFGAGFHFVDGGYYDNFGMNSLLSWLDEGLAVQAIRAQLPDILILQIRHFPPATKLKGPKTTGWGVQLIAPLTGLYNMRDFAQNSVANNQLAFFTKYYATLGVRVWKATIYYDGGDQCMDAPVSWKLDERQANCIPKTWNERVIKKPNKALKCINAYVWGSDPAGNCTPADVPDQE
jgi:hypothetical protein